MERRNEGMHRHRNYGCRIREVDYNGVRLVGMDNELVHVGILAGKGSDIYEFVYKPMDVDFMWKSFQGVRNPKDYVVTKESAHGKFLDLYEGGWQELFPSYGADSDYMNAEFGIHGEVSVAPWDYTVVTDTVEEICVKFSVRTPRTPYLLEKWMTLKTGDPALYVRERVTNEGGVPLQFMWGHHPALGVPFLSEDCEIIINGDCTVHTFDIDTALPADQTFHWPLAQDRAGKEINLSQVRAQGVGKYLEYGVSGVQDGRYVVWNRKLGVGFGMAWDMQTYPYLWIWEPNAALPGYPWYGRNYTLGVEPWSHLSRSLDEVAAKNEGIHIEPGACVETAFTAFVEIQKPR